MGRAREPCAFTLTSHRHTGSAEVSVTCCLLWSARERDLFSSATVSEKSRVEAYQLSRGWCGVQVTCVGQVEHRVCQKRIPLWYDIILIGIFTSCPRSMRLSRFPDWLNPVLIQGIWVCFCWTNDVITVIVSVVKSTSVFFMRANIMGNHAS
jgi:hypothetical protein